MTLKPSIRLAGGSTVGSSSSSGKLPLTYGDYYSPDLGPSLPQSGEGSSVDELDLDGGIEVEQLLIDLRGDQSLETELLDQLDLLHHDIERVIRRFNRQRGALGPGGGEFGQWQKVMMDYQLIEALRAEAKSIQDRLTLMDERQEKAKEVALYLIGDLRLGRLCETVISLCSS